MSNDNTIRVSASSIANALRRGKVSGKGWKLVGVFIRGTLDEVQIKLNQIADNIEYFKEPQGYIYGNEYSIVEAL